MPERLCSPDVRSRDRLQVAIDQAMLAAGKAMTSKTDAELATLVANWVAASGLYASYARGGTACTAR